MKTFPPLKTSEWVRKEPLFLDKKDDRYEPSKKQLKTRGFCDSETWGLDSTITKFILPRLIRFREIDAGYPGFMTAEEWTAILDKMIFAFQWSYNWDEHEFDITKVMPETEQEAGWEEYRKGMELFAKYYRHLWW